MGGPKQKGVVQYSTFLQSVVEEKERRRAGRRNGD